MPLDFSKKSVVFITGASRGIGREIALELSRNINHVSTLVLIARSTSGLEETKRLIGEVDKLLNVTIVPLDLSKPDSQDYENVFQKIINTTSNSDIENAIFFHNAGTLGILKRTLDVSDLTAWREHYDINMFSTILLNSLFLKHFNSVSNTVIVNISSLCGKVPFKNMAMYGSVKAARELYFKVLAIEEPHLSVLNYSPGPVDTDMFNSVITEAESTELKNNFKEIKDTSNLLTTEQTVSKLLKLVETMEFKSGDTIDYFDRST